jgi:hypothetical protein
LPPALAGFLLGVLFGIKDGSSMFSESWAFTELHGFETHKILCFFTAALFICYIQNRLLALLSVIYIMNFVSNYIAEGAQGSVVG